MLDLDNDYIDYIDNEDNIMRDNINNDDQNEDSMDSDDQNANEIPSEHSEVSINRPTVTTQASPNVFPFMRLPAEVREHVYEWALGSPIHIVHINETSTVSDISGRRQAAVWCWGEVSTDIHRLSTASRRRNMASRTINPALLRSCRLVYCEGLRFLYMQRFHFLNAQAMQTFLLTLHHNTVTKLRHVELYRRTPARAEDPMVLSALASLTRAVNLQVVRVHGLWFYGQQGRGFRYDLGPVPANGMMGPSAWDILVGRNLARAAYRQMYPFLQCFLRSQNRGANLLQELLNGVFIFEDIIRDGPRVYGNEIQLGMAVVHSPNLVVAGAFWTDARRAATRQAMAMEILRCVRLDS
ncbi:hypothetical protein M406DRAFT_329464 [Cryphonectria parasitica EP155]|uniref:DUF7730 domain-containing protein n=1 Tax=Cryphonectria parasitica (strain ATCC 38755 / EP155) TaxID=660469 RepID=A0A9P4Y318_CRYP1|nr:uncharacterized protein M406DRAFT_329464 [Cryphonectria parasitica EP155]KAF3765569.1 hypothetical protein M406DRAFT_329464 [Cryphonectria parasitica EP155]